MLYFFLTKSHVHTCRKYFYKDIYVGHLIQIFHLFLIFHINIYFTVVDDDLTPCSDNKISSNVDTKQNNFINNRKKQKLILPEDAKVMLPAIKVSKKNMLHMFRNCIVGVQCTCVMIE